MNTLHAFFERSYLVFEQRQFRIVPNEPIVHCRLDEMSCNRNNGKFCDFQRCTGDWRAAVGKSFIKSAMVALHRRCSNCWSNAFETRVPNGIVSIMPIFSGLLCAIVDFQCPRTSNIESSDATIAVRPAK